MSGTNVEDPISDPTPEPSPAPAAPEPAPVVAEAAPQDPDEQQALEVQGGKYVPLDALKSTRAELKEARERARESDTLRQQLAQAQGALGAFQHLQQQLQRPQAPQPQDQPPDPKLVEYARSLDYYKADGSPDLERAGKFAQLVRTEAHALAQQAVEPLAQRNNQSMTAANYQRALATKTPQGRQAKAETVKWMFENLPPQLTADPRVAAVLPVLALGLDEYTGQHALPDQPARPAGPPVMTEASGGTIRPRGPAISDTGKAIAAARGMSEKSYVDYTKDFRPGRPNILED